MSVWDMLRTEGEGFFKMSIFTSKTFVNYLWITQEKRQTVPAEHAWAWQPGSACERGQTAQFGTPVPNSSPMMASTNSELNHTPNTFRLWITFPDRMICLIASAGRKSRSLKIFPNERKIPHTIAPSRKRCGLGSPAVKAQQPRPSLVSGFLFFHPCCAGAASFFGGPCRDTREGVPVP